SFLPSLFRGLNFTPTLAAILLPILRLVIFGAIREGIIVGLWRVLVERLNIAASEMVYVTH
ncbi:MAG TPA: hypothetical protein VLK33_01935, partial [Terriglobales bacterium]|nr:hypothetical protein [Terriglobales bacterium]